MNKVRTIEIYDHGGGDEAIAKLDAGQAFRAAVIFGHGLQDDAPPEIPVNLDVPFLPAGIDRNSASLPHRGA